MVLRFRMLRVIAATCETSVLEAARPIRQHHLGDIVVTDQSDGRLRRSAWQTIHAQAVPGFRLTD
jgi:hypothetical protein